MSPYPRFVLTESESPQRWLAEAKRIEIEIAQRLDYAPISPDIDFVAFLKVFARFGFFTFGPVTIDVNLVEDLLERTHPRGDGSATHPPVSPEYVEFTDHLWRMFKASGRKHFDELQQLLTYMAWGRGLPARVFGELGVRAEDVERYVSELGRPGATSPVSGERLYSIEQAADYLDVHVQTVRRWIRSGRITASRLAGQKSIRIRQSDLDSVLEPIEPGRLTDD